jgi:hypothetical protein
MTESGTESTGTRVEDLKDTHARKTLPGMCSEYRRLAEEAGALGLAMKAVKADIDEAVKKTRVKKIVGDGWMVLKVTRNIKSIKQELLLEQGVDMDVIEAATVEKSSTSIQVRKGAAD